MKGSIAKFLSFSLLFVMGYLSYAWYLRHKLKEFDSLVNPISLSDSVSHKVRQDQLLNLGWISKNENDENSYLNFINRTSDSIKLIGLFGDSFVEGSEVNYQYNITSFINQIYQAKGKDSIRVVNFGTSGYGQHQSFLLWSYFGKPLNLHKTVFSCHAMHIERDKSFSLYFLYKPVHARFILKNDSVELVSISDAGREAAAESYHRFFPPVKYWLYDHKLPTLLKPLGFLEVNPFYYVSHDSVTSEILLTYNKLFQAIKNSSKDFRMLIESEPKEKWLDSAFRNFSRTDFNFPDHLAKENRTLYFAPNGHYNSIGNYLQAIRLYNFLERDSISYSVFASPRFVFDAQNIHATKDIDSIDWFINGKRAGNLFTKKTNRYFSSVYRFTEKAQSVLIVRFTDEHLFLIPLKSNLDEVYNVRFDIDGATLNLHLEKMNDKFYLIDLTKREYPKNIQHNKTIQLQKLLHENSTVSLTVNNYSRVIINEGITEEGGYFRLRAHDFPFENGTPDSLTVSARCYSANAYHDYLLVKYFKTFSAR